MKTNNNIITGIAVSFMLLIGTISAGATSAPENFTGNSQTLLGQYQITELEPETVNNETMRKFQLDYENGVAPVTIYLSERRNCREYIVRSKVMEVQYVCNKKGFGAAPVSSRNSLYPEQTNKMFLSSEALGYQERITEGEVDLQKALGLIACYYPSLLKNIQNLAKITQN